MKKRRLLLDTHVFLWWQANDPRLDASAKEAIAWADVVFVSAASAWEVAIKISLGRLKIPASVEHGVEESGFEKLPVHFVHAEAVADLPPHHADPFDRLLIAQSRLERLTLATHDQAFAPYALDILWV